MRVGFVGPDLILEHGGSQTHALNVINILKNKYKYEFVYFPDPILYPKYRVNRENILKKVAELERIGIRMACMFYEALNRDLHYGEIVKLYAREVKDVDLLYDFDFLNRTGLPIAPVLDLSKVAGVRFSVTIQGLGDLDLRLSRYLYGTFKLAFQGLPQVIIYRAHHFLDRKYLLYRLFSSKNLVFALVVNNAYFSFIKNTKNKRIFLLNPSNGIFNYGNVSINKYLGLSKEDDKIIYFARLNYHKGLFDSVRVLRHIVSMYGRVKFTVIGKFLRDSERRLFFRQLRRWGLDKFVEYRGFLPDDELYRELATAKVMVYPSHSDSFSIAVAQSLFFETPVVAYDIPGLWAYRGLPAVRFVKEFDYEGMAREVVNILRMDDVSLLFTDEVISFLKRHTWDEVARQYHEVFMRYVSHEL